MQIEIYVHKTKVELTDEIFVLNINWPKKNKTKQKRSLIFSFYLIYLELFVIIWWPDESIKTVWFMS